MESRQQKILKAIVESFIKSAQPIGSMMIYEQYDFDVSPATIRNEMAALEREGYILQPHTSAGRIPTTQGYRNVVDQLELTQQMLTRAQRDLRNVRHQYYLKKTREKLYDTVSILSGATRNVCFATVPEKEKFFYIGLSNVLKLPEFSLNPQQTVQVVEVLENQLYDALSEIDMQEEGICFIGEENILPEIKSCSLLAQPYSYNGFQGVMGILGSTRMDYAYNMAALKMAVQLIND